MYFKEDKEGFNNNYGDNKSFLFPNWLVIIIVLLIIAVVIGLILFMTKNNNKTQKFGFRFY